MGPEPETGIDLGGRRAGEERDCLRGRVKIMGVCGWIQSDLGIQGGGKGVRLPGCLRLDRGNQGPGALSGVPTQT